MIPAEDGLSFGRVHGEAHTDAQGGSTVLRVLLGTQLRRLRTAKDISREDAGYAIKVSPAKISRMELGEARFKTRDVGGLLTLYGVRDPQERATLMALVDCANVPGWWQEYEDVLPSWFDVYMELEESASVIRAYELQFIPGLLQTEDYATAVIQLSCPASATELEQRVSMRMRRQQRLTGSSSLRFWAVVDEAALRRPYGDPKVMRAQIEHLIEMAELPNVTLQVLPFSHGGHAAAGGPFSIMRFTAPQLSDVVYLEQLDSALYLDKSEETQHYMVVMDRLCVQASPPSATPALLTALHDEIS